MNLRLTPALLLATLLLAACTGSDDEPTPDPTATPSPTATATPTSTATPPPEDTTDLPFGLTPSPPDTWQSLELHPGDEIPDSFGVFIADPTTGAGTLWALNPSVIQGYAFLRATRNGNYVFSGPHLVNTATGQSFTWGDETSLRDIDDRGLALFTSGARCTFSLVDLSGDEPTLVAAHQFPDFIAQHNCQFNSRLSPDAKELLVVARKETPGGGTALHTIDLLTGISEQIAAFEVPNAAFEGDASSPEIALLSGTLPGAAWVASYNWSTRTLTSTRIETGALPPSDGKAAPHPRPLLLSPDGRWIAWSDTDDLGTGFGLGGHDEWPVVVIASVEDTTPVVRVQRVALTNGIVTFDWLPDSSALVVQHQQGFALLSPDGTLEDLPFPVAFHNDPVPIPAPDGTERFLWDGQPIGPIGEPLGEIPAVVDAWAAPLTQSDRHSWWFGTSYRWSSAADRLLFSRSLIGGKDFGRGGIATLGLPPRITTGPAAATPDLPIRLRVASDGDNLNVRSAPGLAAERIGKFPHGTLVTISRDTTIDYCGERGCSILNDPDLPYGTSWWLYVHDESGLKGWVTSEFVEWAD